MKPKVNVKANENSIIEKNPRSKKKVLFQQPIIEELILEESIIEKPKEELLKTFEIYNNLYLN